MIYVVDILHKNQTAFIFLSAQQNDATALHRYISEQYGATYKLGIGSVVHNCENLTDSYLDSLVSLETVIAPIHNTYQQLPDLEDFVSENTALFLEYVKNGDCDAAVRVLDTLMQFINREIHTVLYQRYIHYSLLSAYIRLVKQLGYPMDTTRSTELLSYTDVHTLFDALGSHVKEVCAHISSMKLNIYDTLRRDVMTYINENFTDVDLCRDQIADHFGISVYSLSRIFKDTIDVGFKEYVNAKRLTLSKTLLLTTQNSIAQIAAQVGFTSADYFTKLFRSTFDLTHPNTGRNIVSSKTSKKPCAFQSTLERAYFCCLTCFVRIDCQD